MGAVATPHPENFVYLEPETASSGRVGTEPVSWRVQRYASDVFHLEVSGRRWSKHTSDLAKLEPKAGAGASELNSDLAKLWLKYRGRRLLSGHPAGCFGISGTTWALRFQTRGDERYFGMGAKWGTLEKSGLRTSFWNTDVWAHFDIAAIREGRADPMYGSVPYLIVQRGSSYSGILIDSPGRAFMHVPPRPARAASASLSLLLGAELGAPSVYFLVGPSLAELTCKLQRLVGVTPRPPLWALGHHQSRWGYRGKRDLLALDAEFARHEFPCDALWLDIDYMDGFRVFTTSPRYLPEPRRTLSRLRAKGRRVVAIIDPGVKREPGYRVYDEGKERGHFCITPERRTFVGLVWPGETVFPDFAQPKVQQWWAQQVAEFMDLGFAGFWLDMNEPACGAVDDRSMLFDGGRLEHGAYHNRYALGMAQATHRGLLQHDKNQRPFLITRAHSQGISRYAAVWTGDNYSNERHLQQSIATTLNLSLSGVPFNGPDVPGFGGDADADLLVRWYKLSFLFPFLRNHSCTGTRQQEPWAFSKAALQQVRHFVRLRYKLLPYLYSLFIQQERSGTPIVRPLFYDEEGQAEDALFEAEHQFCIGPSLMQAPIVARGSKARRVCLPAGSWYEAHTGRWRRGGRMVTAREQWSTTPLYVREGHILPMLSGTPKDTQSCLAQLELHVFLRRRSSMSAELTYEVDDGQSFAYRRGKVSRFTLRASVVRGTLAVIIDDLKLDYRPLQVSLVLYADFRQVEIGGEVRARCYRPRAAHFRFTGEPLKVWRTPLLTLGSPDRGGGGSPRIIAKKRSS